jgi:hypothetical protein
MKRLIMWFVCGISLSLLAAGAHAGHAGNPDTSATNRRVMHWNEVMLRANAIDHTPVPPDQIRRFGEQYGPARTARAFAIVQLAVFDALNAIEMRYPSYAGLPCAPGDTSPDAAIAQAAHDALVAIWPSQARMFDAQLAADLSRIPFSRARFNGIAVGRQAAQAILALRAQDLQFHPDPVVYVNFFPSNAPGKWRPDPVSFSRIPIALGADWAEQTRPFVIPGTGPFRAPPPPALTSAEYTEAFNEIKRLGGDGITTPTARTREQTIIGIYWSYDGTALIGAVPRLYNQIALEIARPRTADPLEMARLLALLNTAISDAALTVWDDKYRYQFWRPITGIRESDPGTGPTGLGDGNPDTRGDPGWTPFGAPASNMPGFPNFTPPFPSYPSGHAGLGGAAFQILRRFYGTDRIAFSFVSDEFNGITRDNRGRVRPRLVRSFSSLTQAELENRQSRIYLGVHWRFDITNGATTGRRVGNDVFTRGLVPPHS